MSNHQTRQPLGTPAGGQFSTSPRNEPAVTLTKAHPTLVASAEEAVRSACTAVGLAQAEVVLASQRTGLRARLRDDLLRASVDLHAAEARLTSSRGILRSTAGANTPPLYSDEDRVASFRSAVGELPDAATAQQRWESVTSEVNHWTAESAAAGYYGPYDSEPRAERKRREAVRRQAAARLVLDAVLESQ